jgi:flagellin-like hook-associated protein FlgL
MNLNGQDISLKLSAGLYSRSALVTELNNKLGGRATASLNSNYLRITNPKPGNDIINVNLDSVGGNAANTLFRTYQGSFSVSGNRPSSGSSPTAGSVYRINSGSHDADTTISPPDNIVRFAFYDGVNYDIEIPAGTYTESELYNEMVAQVSSHPSLSARVKTRSNYGFESLHPGSINSFNITGTPSDWLYTMITRTEDGSTKFPSNGSIYANGRVEMIGEVILTEENNELTFDVIKDGELSSYTVKIPPGKYPDNESFLDALNEAFIADGLPQMEAKMIDEKRPDGSTFKSLQFEYIPDSPGEYRLEGFRGTAAHELFYRHPFRPENVWLQVGAYSKDMYRTDIPILMTYRMLRQYANVSTQETANTAIDLMDDAINYVSTKRAITGADFNALSHMLELRKIQELNITDAESHIRDVDVAEEYMDFQLRRVNTQVSKSMLAQANEVNKQALDLLA